MQVRLKSTSQLGEALSFKIIDGECWFNVMWYGIPGLTTARLTDIEAPLCTASSSSL